MIGLISRFKYVFLFIALVSAIGGAIWLTYEKGYSAGEAAEAVKCDKRVNDIREEYKQAQRDAQEEYERKKEQAVSAEREYWKENQETEVRYETIEKEVIRYVERGGNADCRVDDEFMRIWNAANANRDRAEAGANQ
jgi:hypothetical protein